MKKRLLAISGKRFSGKDTLAALLVERARVEHGVTLTAHAFAGESKRLFVVEEQRGGNDVDLARLVGDRAYKEQWRPRLTAFTERSLAADPLVFCRSVADAIEVEATPSIVTDVRLTHEVEHLRARFELHLVRLVRSDAARLASGWVYAAKADEHHTETELDDPSWWDATITNDAATTELEAEAARLLRRWLR